jgi:hypothetical protein
MKMHRIHTAREYIAAAEACFGSSIIWVITVIAVLAELIAQIVGELTEIISDSLFLYAHAKHRLNLLFEHVYLNLMTSTIFSA